VERNSCILRVQKKGRTGSGLPAITLYQCLPKGRKLDTIVRQATELGVARIVPVESRYSIPKPGDRDSRLGRLTRVAREAAQQSGAPRIPEISQVIRLRDIPGNWEREGENPLGLFFHQAPLETTSLHEYLSIRRDSIAMVVGPEGGLADEEIKFLRSEGFVPVYLGPTVLRTETAPVFAAAAVHMIILENKTWKLVR
jgi:16S rRNA (uracil1498-N3)-methyltransferase